MSLPLPSAPEPAPAPDTLPTPVVLPAPDADLAATQSKPRRRTGKIAELPRAQRDLINQMLDDGATYKSIAEELVRLGVTLNAENLSNHFQGGYQDYLAHQEWLAQIALLREHAADLPHDPADELVFHQAVLGLGVTQIFRTLKINQLKDDPAHYTRALNSLCRLAREHLVLQKYQDTRARQQASTPKQLDENRKISNHERNAVLRRWTDFFGHDLTQPADADTLQPPDTAAAAPPQSTAADEPSGPEPTPAPETVPSPEPLDAQPINPIPTAAPPTLATLSIQNPETSNLPTPALDPQPQETANPAASSPAASKPPTQVPPAHHCSACNLLLPPLLKNGEFALPVCPQCGSGLFHARWTKPDYPRPNNRPTPCDLCRQRHKLDPNGLPDPCSHCGFPNLPIH